MQTKLALIPISAKVVCFLFGGCADRPAAPTSFGSGVAPEHASTSTNPVVEPVTSDKIAVGWFREKRASIGLNPIPQEQVIAHREPMRSCLARVQNTLTPAEMKTCIRAGNLSSLDQDGDCWVVEVQGGMLGGQIAYFNDQGQLLFAWLVPEG